MGVPKVTVTLGTVIKEQVGFELGLEDEGAKVAEEGFDGAAAFVGEL